MGNLRMRYILGIDIETSGLDPEKDKIIELGAVLWDWSRKKPVMMLSEIFFYHNFPLSTEIQSLTGITSDDLVNFGNNDQFIFDEFKNLYIWADCIMIHNAPFDLSFLNKWFSKFSFSIDIPVIDTLTDLPIDPNIHKRKDLLTLSANHDFLNPFKHRALFDVLTMLKIASHYSLDKILERTNSKSVNLIADVTYDDRMLAKNAGFKWNAERKEWIMTAKAIDVENKKWGFPVFEERKT